MLSKGHCRIVKRPPGNESISFCFIAVHTRQLLIACQKKKSNSIWISSVLPFCYRWFTNQTMQQRPSAPAFKLGTGGKRSCAICCLLLKKKTVQKKKAEGRRTKQRRTYTQEISNSSSRTSACYASCCIRSNVALLCRAVPTIADGSSRWWARAALLAHLFT